MYIDTYVLHYYQYEMMFRSILHPCIDLLCITSLFDDFSQIITYRTLYLVSYVFGNFTIIFTLPSQTVTQINKQRFDSKYKLRTSFTFSHNYWSKRGYFVIDLAFEEQE